MKPWRVAFWPELKTHIPQGFQGVNFWYSPYKDSMMRIYILKFYGCIIEASKWISKFISDFAGHVIIYPCWGKSESVLGAHDMTVYS